MLYYLLPEINKKINPNDLKLNLINKENGQINEIFISKSFWKYLNKLKLLINKHSDSWDITKKYTNPYEFIHTNIPYVNISIGKYKPISRAFFKLVEIYNHFNLIHFNKNIKTFHLAEGPGGFIEATYYLRNNRNDRYYGITLINNDDHMIPGWNKSQNYLKKRTNIIIEKGATGDGDLYNHANFKQLCEKYQNSMEIVTADGGFDFSSDFNHQENNVFKLLYTQVMYAVALQKHNGHFVIKIFDIFLKNTCQLMYLLSCFYKKVYVTKPNTSRYANSEKYVVCKYFKLKDTKDISDRFYKILHVLGNVDMNIYEINNILNHKIQFYYLLKIEEINAIFINQQVENILNTIKLISYGDKRKDKIDTLKSQNIIKCIQWCEQFNIPYNKNYNKINTFITHKKN